MCAYSHLLIYGMFPPGSLDVGVAFQCLPSFFYMIIQQLQLARNEVGITRIPRPCGNINDIQTRIYRCSDRGELWNDEGRCLRCRGYGKVIGG